MPDLREAIRGSELVREVRLGERQVEGPLAVFPIFVRGVGAASREVEALAGGHDAPRPPRYITLRQALGEGLAVITEVSEGGSVPELCVVNTGDARILVLDGEELRGAKQNRVLSTAILIDGHSTLGGARELHRAGSLGLCLTGVRRERDPGGAAGPVLDEDQHPRGDAQRRARARRPGRRVV